MKLTKKSSLLLLLTTTVAMSDELLSFNTHSVRENIENITEVDNEVDVSETNKLKKMFKKAKISGELRSMYAGYNQKELGVDNNYATAVGGVFKYTLGAYHGFNAGVALYASYDITDLSGSNAKHNDELSSSKKSYTQLGEAYINYENQEFSFRAGRQVLDTPLADSDDIRMISNSFEAYVAKYNYNGFEFMLGNIQSWQGYDAGLESSWSKTGDNGTNFGGISYSDTWELNIWYYNITGMTNVIYLDGGMEYNTDDNINIHAMMQYVQEDELSNSGYDSKIYGAMVEFTTYQISVNIAYNKALSGTSKMSFSGFGGGALFTSMDTLILDEIANDREASSVVGSVSYEIGGVNLLYAYGDFSGSANSLGNKEHIVEQDVSLEYNMTKKLLIACIYSMQEDKENLIKTEHDWDHARVVINYNF
jgi:hypothetical protein